jgi:hypothetical protein
MYNHHSFNIFQLEKIATSQKPQVILYPPRPGGAENNFTASL